jgi:hypothetical protein
VAVEDLIKKAGRTSAGSLKTEGKLNIRSKIISIKH